MRRAAVLFAFLALAACSKKERPLTTNLNVENKVAMRAVYLFYEGPPLLLSAESRNIALPENPKAALPAVLRELLKGSANSGVPPLFPTDTVLRAAYLLPGGTALVDLGGPTLTEGWATGSHQELMAIQSVVETVVANFPETKQVRVLLNGAPAETLGGHVWLGRAFAPQPSMVSGASGSRNDGNRTVVP